MMNIGKVFTETLLELFVLNNKVLAYGDRLVSDLGLTSARWQVLHYIAKAENAQPVSWIARDMSSNRQNVQRIVNDLVKNNWAQLQPNPHHKTAHLVTLTKEGEQVYQATMERQELWINRLTKGLDASEIEMMRTALGKIRQNLEDDS